MKAKMVLFLFVMGVILGGCSVKSNKDILLDDTKTIIKYSPYQKMFMDLNSNFTEEDVKKYMGDHRLIGGRSSLGDYFEYMLYQINSVSKMRYRLHSYPKQPSILPLDRL